MLYLMPSLYFLLFLLLHNFATAPITVSCMLDVRCDAVEQSSYRDETSQFDALRETIYSEVATLISQNENHPHYLIELFRELQQLTTDHQHQQAIVAFERLVTEYQTDDNFMDDRLRQLVGISYLN